MKPPTIRILDDGRKAYFYSVTDLTDALHKQRVEEAIDKPHFTPSAEVGESRSVNCRAKGKGWAK